MKIVLFFLMVATGRSQKKKILIVEDDTHLSRFYQSALERNGFHVCVCDEGSEGLLRAVSYEPDVILLDILIPFIDGFDFINALRINGLTTKIFVLSNLNDQKSVQKAIKLGADKYFCKIDNPPLKIVEEINNFIGRES